MTSTRRSAVGSSTVPKSALAEAAPATRAGIAATGRTRPARTASPSADRNLMPNCLANSRAAVASWPGTGRLATARRLGFVVRLRCRTRQRRVRRRERHRPRGAGRSRNNRSLSRHLPETSAREQRRRRAGRSADPGNPPQERAPMRRTTPCRPAAAGLLALTGAAAPAWAESAKIERVSVSTAGEQGGWHSFNAAMSADGRFVAFTLQSTNLVTGDTNQHDDIFVRDRVKGTTELASLNGSISLPRGISG